MVRQLLTSPAFLVCLFFVLITLLSLQRWLHWRRRCRAAEARLQQAERQRSEQEEELQRWRLRAEQDAAFAADLSRAELATRFQHPRLQQQDGGEAAVPERYRYVQRLSDSGMSAEQVAELLAISPHEAQQLVRLARLGARS
ncbi:hypothetical protein [Desulfofustis limnaeus]|jgi:hypothetical protein|uniref:DUF2802 domain-containing protein n=1 Tax=Desulfofustis limnaeus TaxID=2740163 RepID=A0ABM7W8U3_9BACT|nr:hypothetical protein [Desulfofustis limnaeus]BDD87352.1 hypothetical protein DPPLL_17170 [Desulfofustis limnaeus]